MDQRRLREMAARFRQAIEAVPHVDRPIALQSFPRGSCGDASLLLGAYLVDNDITGFEYVCGERGDKSRDTWTSHGWLRNGTCVVDITADQFADGPSGIVVADPSTWHTSFNIDKT